VGDWIAFEHMNKSSEAAGLKEVVSFYNFLLRLIIQI
jgi:hypothetical protein